MNRIPAPLTAFRPRADAGLLSRLLSEAWREVQDGLNDEKDRLAVAEGLAAHLEQLYPAADMSVLERYNATETTSHVSVRMWNPTTSRWDQSALFDLPRAVVVPACNLGLCVGGRWFSHEPDYGVRPEARAAMTPYEWRTLVAYHDDSDRRRVPEAFEPYFAAIVAAREAYRAEYGRCTAWPAERRAAIGAYPTWAEIEAEFPTLGAYIARRREAEATERTAA